MRVSARAPAQYAPHVGRLHAVDRASVWPEEPTTHTQVEASADLQVGVAGAIGKADRIGEARLRLSEATREDGMAPIP